MAQAEGKTEERGGLVGHNLRSGVLLVVFGGIGYSIAGSWGAATWIFPNVVSVGLVAFGLLCILIGVVKREPIPFFEDRLTALDAVWFPVSLFAYVWFVSNFGYLRSTVAFLTIMSFVLSPNRRVTSIVFKVVGGVLGGLLLYFVFAEGFNVRLPRG